VLNQIAQQIHLGTVRDAAIRGIVGIGGDFFKSTVIRLGIDRIDAADTIGAGYMTSLITLDAQPYYYDTHGQRKLI
jgi:hypothetical protein